MEANETRAFNKWMDERFDMAKTDILAALGSSSRSAFPGTLAEAKQCILDWQELRARLWDRYGRQDCG